MITKGFEILNKNTKVVIYPIINDMITFIYGILVTAFFVGTSMIKLTFTINPGIPSMFNLLDEKNKFEFQTINVNNIDLTFLIIIIISFLINAFIQAGFIGLLIESINKRKPSFKVFLDYGKKYWLRFVGVALIMISFMLLSLFLGLLLSGFGILVAIILFIILRILFIFWEYTIIVDDLKVFEALRLSREYFRNRVPETTSVIVRFFIINAIFALILNLIPNTLVYFIGIIVYGYVATGFVLALLLTLISIKGKLNPVLNTEEDILDDKLKNNLETDNSL